MENSDGRLKIAVVGCGVAGLTAGWLLSRQHDIHFFEKNEYIGGHTRTLKISEGPDKGLPVDTGFIVMNHRNYPLFSKLLEQLGVNVAESSMTFSFHDRRNGYGYSGNNLQALFPQLSYLFSRPHWSLIRDLKRFAKLGFQDLNSGFLEGKTLGEYFSERPFGEPFLNTYLYPMGAAIWSSPLARMADFPAQPYLHFLENHGLLRLTNRPQWQYVAGGSRTYVEAMLKSFKRKPQINCSPKCITRQEKTGKVELEFPDGRVDVFDHVVIGTHADEALALLADPSPKEKETLGKWKYQPNRVILHTDTRFLPPNPKQWSSWNFLRENEDPHETPVAVSYYMNRLQRLQTQENYIVTLNPVSEIASEKVINETTLTHPLYSFESMATQAQLMKMNGQRNTSYCGSYFGYGFHEDAVRSAVEVSKNFGIEL